MFQIHRHLRTRALVACALLLALLSGCEQTAHLERVRDQGVLKVATRVIPGIYYPAAPRRKGFEFELVYRFAEQMGIGRVEFIVSNNEQGLLELVRSGKVHMAAANLAVTPRRGASIDFSEPYHRAREQLVYRRGNTRPRTLDDIPRDALYLLPGSGHVEQLEHLRDTLAPQLSWRFTGDITSSQLLSRVNRGDIPLTVLDSNELKVQLRYYRFLKVALDLESERNLAWAFPRAGDGSLRSAADDFLRRARDDGSLDRLRERYFGHSGKLNFVDKRSFWRHMRERLPRLKPYFEEAAEETGIDWRLLAAIGYQESHWSQDAVSPTGVKGIMMLTRQTARQLNIGDRTDPRESIIGGARYLLRLEDKLPARIPEPDRLWLTLAAYNVGFGHLEDARILTQRRDGNPDLWKDVKLALPLLEDPAIYRTVKRGKARGREPVAYVENIRNYYDLLVWAGNRSISEAEF